VNANYLKWLERLPGFDGGQIPQEADLRLTWLHMPQSWGVFALLGIVIALGYLVVLLYQIEQKTCPRGVKVLLACLRIAVLLILAAIFLGPALTYSNRRTEKPWVVLMRDDSQSMNTADRYMDDDAAAAVARATGRTVAEIRDTRPTRAALVQEVLQEDDGRFLWQLQGRGKLRVLDFSDRVKQVQTRPAREPTSDGAAPGGTPDGHDAAPADASTGLPELAATGTATDVFRAIKEGLARRPAAAIVMFTDGQHTKKESIRQALDKAKLQGDLVPLLIVGIGDPSRPRNLKVSDVYVDPQVWQDDPFEVQAMIRAQGVEQPSVGVELIEQRITADGKPVSEGRIVARHEVRLPEGGGQARTVFEHKVESAGRYAYTVRVQTLEDELSEEDNQLAPPVEVKALDQQARVLLIAGAPTWEYQLVQRVLTRDKSVNLSGWLQSMDPDRAQEGNTVINRLPDTERALYEYDVIMLFDPNPRDFDLPWIQLLKRFCSDHAGGILYMAGPKYAGRFLDNERTRGMRGILPVRLGDVGAMEVASLLATNSRAWPLGAVRKNIGQPIMRFYAEEERSFSRWETLPGVYWSFPAQEAKPAARVLIEHSDPTLRRTEGSRPLLVTGQYGSGRTVYIGFNGTWRWRRIGPNAEFFRRFWIQTTRYLVEGRSLEGKRRGLMETEKDVYDLGDSVKVTAQLKDRMYRPLASPQIEAIHQVADMAPQRVTLKPVPDQPGQYEATITARQTGFHSLSIRLADDTSAEPATISTKFSVRLPSVEMGELWLNDKLLKEVAAASGGSYYQLDQLDQVAAAVPDREQTIVVPGKPVLLWDALRVPILVMLVGLLSVEWAVRKWFKLL